MSRSAFETRDALDLLSDPTLQPYEKLSRLFDLFASTQEATRCLTPTCHRPAEWCGLCARDLDVPVSTDCHTPGCREEAVLCATCAADAHQEED